MKKNDFIIDSNFEDYITPLTSEEFINLEENIIEHGCKDPLVIWENDKKERVLIDGHNRYQICIKHKIAFQVKIFHFNTDEEAKYWMINNQLGRRNLNPDELSYYRGLKYHINKQGKGGYKAVENKGVMNSTTSEKLAQEFKVSEKTIKRDEKFYLGLNSIAKNNLKLRNEVLKGGVKIPKQKLIKLSDIQIPAFYIFGDKGEIKRKIDYLLNEPDKSFQDDIQEEEMIELNLSGRDKTNVYKGKVLSALNTYINSKNGADFEKIIKNLDKLKKYLT